MNAARDPKKTYIRTFSDPRIQNRVPNLNRLAVERTSDPMT